MVGATIAGNLFDDPTMSMMYRDALQSLYNGAVMPWDREILAVAPLPADVVDPFASEKMDPCQVMGFAYNSLVTWIDEAKKANYFSKHFTDLSKLVLKGVTTMGRGLMTLHYRGESLDGAPMQINDLISVASYHFRKSYLGVIQTAKSHPEISERLLLNQLSWTNMLMRLYKTREKLSLGVRSQVSGVSDSGAKIEEQGSRMNEEGRIQNEGLLNGNSDNSSFLTLNSSFDQDDVHAFSDVAALSEPAAISAPHALTPMRNKEGRTTENQKSEIRNRKSSDNEEVRSKNEERVPDSGARIEDQGTRLNEEGRTSDNEEVRRKNEETDSGDSDQVSGVRDSGTRIEEQGSRLNEEGRSLPNEEERIQNEGLPDRNSDNSSFLHHNSSLNDDSSFLPLHSSLNENLPPYIQILRNAFGRSEPNEEGRLTFTFDEIRYLASDPDFARIYPDAAADMRCMLQRIDSG